MTGDFILKTVLVVDDEAAIVQLICKTLEGHGYRAIGTTRPIEVSLLLDAHEVDLLVLDCVMPGKTGMEVFDDVKRASPRLPILFATGYPEAFSLDSESKLIRWRERMTDGMTDVIYKPFDLQSLCSKVEGLIGPPEDPASP